MAKSLITKKFGNHHAEQFIESITEPANSVYYLTASKHTPYPDDNNVPDQGDNFREIEVNFYDELIFGKKITSADVSKMVPRYNWTTGTVYNRYDDTDSELFTKQFYVACDTGSMYYVYKILNNNNGAASTVNPSGASISESACNFITTADGYVWKLMYKMTEAEFEKFATNDYMPVVKSANVAGNTVSGAIDVVLVANAGSNYVSTLDGTFNATDLRDTLAGGNTTTYRLSANAAANNSFYVGSALYITGGTGMGQLKKITSYNASTRVAVVNSAFSVPPSSGSTYLISPLIEITGDGSNAVGYATVSSGGGVNNYISGVTITDRGYGYSYATVNISGNTGGVSNTASFVAVIPPVGGHGFNAPEELGSSYLGISVKFNTSESGFITVENDYRKIGIIKDPLFKKATLTLGAERGTFSTGETVYQTDYKILTGTITANSSNATLIGTSTEFLTSLSAGDNVIIIDSVNNQQFLRTVSSISNNTLLTLNSNSSFDLAGTGKIAFASLLCSAVKIGNTSPYITLGNVEPKFVTGKKIIGASSGAFANVTAINVQEKSYNNWLTFDNRARISYTANTGALTEDTLVYQSLGPAISNAYFHSANSTFIFLTSERGPINAEPSNAIIGNDGGATYTPGTTKYEQDLQKGTGDVIYIENTSAISRSVSQSETIRLVLKF